MLTCLYGECMKHETWLSRKCVLTLVLGAAGNAASLLCQGVSRTHLLRVSQSSEPSPQAGIISFLCVGGFREEWLSACIPQDTLTTRAPPQLFPETSQRVNPLHQEQQPPGRGRAPAGRAGERPGPQAPAMLCGESPRWACACISGSHVFTGNVVIIINLLLIAEVINVNYLNNWRWQEAIVIPGC